MSSLPTLLHGLECWTVKAKTKSRIVALDMKLIGKSLGYNWTDYKTYTDQLNELKLTSVID